MSNACVGSRHKEKAATGKDEPPIDSDKKSAEIR